MISPARSVYWDVLFFDHTKKPSGMEISNGNRTVTNTVGGWKHIKSTQPLNPLHNHYFEVRIDKCTANRHVMVGLAMEELSLSHYLGQGNQYAFYTTGNGVHYQPKPNAPLPAGIVKQGDVVGLLVNYNEQCVSLYVNKRCIGVVGSVSPATLVYPAVSLHDPGDELSWGIFTVN